MFKKSNIESIEIKQGMKDLSKKIDDALKVYKEKTLSEREFNLLAEKSDIQNKLIDVQTQNIKLKDEVNIKNKTIAEKDKELEEYKEKVKNLSLDYSNMIDYKAKCEKLEKVLSKANKDLATYEEKYGKIPKKVPGSTMPRKKQAIGIKESKVSVAAKTELKKINELREKEEVKL